MEMRKGEVPLIISSEARNKVLTEGQVLISEKIPGQEELGETREEVSVGDIIENDESEAARRVQEEPYEGVRLDLLSREKEISRRDLIKAICTLAALGGISSVFGALGCKRETEKEVEDAKIKRLRNVIVSYLVQPKFSGSEFAEQVSKTRAKLERWVITQKENHLYFSIPAKDFDKKKTLKDLTKSPQNVEFAKLSGNLLKLGEFVFSKPRTYLFRFPYSDFNVERDRQIRIEFGEADYVMSMDELMNFAENESIYGGYMGVRTERGEIMANHGAFVAKEGEPSLQRFVSHLTTEAKTSEEKTQKLLDFVTRKISYDGTNNISDIEVLKKPNEVLFTKGSDCSGKVILYASLLEQAGIPYDIVYLKGHIAVAVEGNFPNRNNLSFTMRGKKYAIAETTAKGFQIGESVLEIPINSNDIEYIQKPGADSKIYNAKTGKPLAFITD